LVLTRAFFEVLEPESKVFAVLLSDSPIVACDEPGNVKDSLEFVLLQAMYIAPRERGIR